MNNFVWYSIGTEGLKDHIHTVLSSSVVVVKFVTIEPEVKVNVRVRFEC